MNLTTPSPQMKDSKHATPESARMMRTRANIVLGILRMILFVIVVIVLMGLLFGAPAMLAALGMTILPTFIDFLVVILLGMLVGFIEIVSRYQDDPFRTALTWPALFYMLVNALVAAAALWTVRLFGWTFLPAGSANPEVSRWSEVIVSGLGAMAIFRSALFVIGKEDQEVSIGPNAILQIMLNTIDKEVDRHRGQERAKIVKEIMEHVDFDDAVRDLTVLSKALMQNLEAKDNVKIDEARKQIEIIAEIDPDVKKYLLGLRIIDVVGEDILRQAIQIRGQEYYIEAQKKRANDRKEKAKIAEGLSAMGQDLKEKFAAPPPKEEKKEAAPGSLEQVNTDPNIAVG